MIEDLLLKPYVAKAWTGSDFSGWVNGPGAIFNVTDFSSLRPGDSALWHQNPGVGVFPFQTLDPDIVGAQVNDYADSDAFDLSPFPNGDDWHFRVRARFRPEHVLPSLGSVEQPAPRFALFAIVSGADFFVGTFDSPILDPDGVNDAREASRVSPQAGNPNVGSEGLWWFRQTFSPPRETQDACLGQASVSLRIASVIAERDAGGYGTGFDQIAVEIYRGAVVEPTEATFPIELFPSYNNSRRWIGA